MKKTCMILIASLAIATSALAEEPSGAGTGPGAPIPAGGKPAGQKTAELISNSTYRNATGMGLGAFLVGAALYANRNNTNGTTSTSTTTTTTP